MPPWGTERNSHKARGKYNRKEGTKKGGNLDDAHSSVIVARPLLESDRSPRSCVTVVRASKLGFNYTTVKRVPGQNTHQANDTAGADM
jgi:hypothetical protein